MKIVCIGDSIVNGYPFERGDSWPSILERDQEAMIDLLQKEGRHEAEKHFCFVNKGVNGETSKQVQNRFERDVVNGAGCVAISVGTNDFIFTQAEPEEVLEHVKEMVRLAVDLKPGGARVVLIVPILTVPELARRFWADGTDYEAVNGKLKRLRHLMLEFAAMQRAMEEKNTGGSENRRLWCIDLQVEYGRWCCCVGEGAAYIDGVHPTREGYRRLAEIIAMSGCFTDLLTGPGLK